MAAAKIDQPDFARHIANDTLNSLNLKTQTNLNEYIVLIVDNHNHDDLCENLSKIISTDRIQGFNDVESSLSFVHSLHDTNIFLIISGTLAAVHAYEFANKSQIISIYVYCMNEGKHAMWTKEIPKIRCTVSNITQLFIHLHADIKQLSGRWPIGEKSFQKAATVTSEWYHLFLLVISHRPKCLEKSYRDMFQECRAYYKNYPRGLRQIDQLAQKYQPSDAIREYTRESFLYRITNHALRTQNMEIIKKFSPFIADLHSQLHAYHQKYYHSKERSIRAVYRGQNMSLDELENLSSICKSRNPIIKLTTFNSASLDPQVALKFIFPRHDLIPCLFEIIITDEYNTSQNHISSYEQVFANISSLSLMPHEQEVLFSLLSHFRVKYVGEPIIQPHRPWVPIVLELVMDKTGKSSSSHFDIVEHLEKETNPQHYADILHLLQVNVEDELKFNKMNWKKWWIKLTNQWGIHLSNEQPLLLRLYDCFTDDKDWLRKAVEMHKDILRSYLKVESNPSSFMHLYTKFKGLQEFPTKGIALYEDYLKQLCTTNTKEVIECLNFAGLTYERIHDKDCALECYEKAIYLDVHDIYKMNNRIENQIKQLKKPVKTIKVKNTEHTVAIKSIDKDFQRMYEAQEEQWSIFWNIKCQTGQNRCRQINLRALGKYLQEREQWYNASDLKIIFRLPDENTQDLTIDDYRLYRLLALHKHISSSALTNDMANNRSLSLWRREKYMHEWALFKELERFLKPFKKKLSPILSSILPQLARLIEKLNLLITLCIAYICIEQETGKVNVKNIPFINITRTNIRQLVFFDLHDSDLLSDLEALQEQPSISKEPICITSDEFDYLNVS